MQTLTLLLSISHSLSSLCPNFPIIDDIYIYIVCLFCAVVDRPNAI